jgi:putative intracellular protease/amidase
VPKLLNNERERRFFQRTQTKETIMKVLMVITSHDQLGNTGKKTGFWLEEFAAPFYALKDAGAEITLASPKGGQPPLDPPRRRLALVVGIGRLGHGHLLKAAPDRVALG